ncbi:uncharacterized protein DS421_4g124780 [Arachis hypogaea]|nr:uncharacterized protein DS421_4g124780 [Arachis hypogaea]
MAHSSTSPSPSKKTQTVHFRATFQIAEIGLVAKIRTLHQHNIELSINNLHKKRSYNTQGFTVILGSRQCSENRFELASRTDRIQACFTEVTGVTASHGSRARRRDTPSRHLKPSRTVLRSEKASVPHSHTGQATAVQPPHQPWRTEKVPSLSPTASLSLSLLHTCMFCLEVATVYEYQNQKYAKSAEDAIADIFRAEKMAGRNQAAKNQTKDLKCATHLLSEKLRNMSEEKKIIIRDLEFGGLMHIPPLRVHHQILRELANSFKLGKTDWKPATVLLKTQSKKKKVVVEDSSPKQAQSYHGYNTLENNEKSATEGEKEVDLRSTEGHYVSSEIIPDVNLGSDDPSSQGHTEQSSVNKPAESMLSLFKENMIVVREETQSEGLAIVPIQVCLPLSQITSMPENEQTPETENEPTPLLQIEGTTKSNPAPEDAAALMMMARTASYVPKADPLPSFSLGLTNSSQEEAATQEGAGGVTTKEKSPQIPTESDRESFEKFETPARTNELTSDMKEKCYLWAIRVKKYANGLTNEFDTVCTLQVQDKYILSKVHLASLAAETHIEAEIVSAMCFILNQQNIKRFQEEVYCLPPNIVNMAIVNHPEGVFLNAKTNRPFRVKDYPMFIPFLDLKKLASHRYGYVISQIRVYAGGPPLKTSDKDREIELPYLNISGQNTSYDCAIYIMKWLEIFQPENIKRLKYEWKNWTQDEVDYFRVEYASRILFHEMNQNKAETIRGSNAIRLSKPSSLLLSPYCQIDSNDIETD